MARERATDTTALVAAAAETFRRKGYRNATIDDIAEAAGISRPTVYKYTRSKQHLLDLMVDQVTGDLSLRIKQAVETGAPPLTEGTPPGTHRHTCRRGDSEPHLLRHRLQRGGRAVRARKDNLPDMGTRADP